MMYRILLVIAVVCLPAVHADDWPQWMGPKRDNVWRESGLVETLPATPMYVWRVPVAGGYSGPSVSNGKVYVTDFTKNDGANAESKQAAGTERILCLDEKTGKELWSQKWPETYGISYPAGPRSTPLVHGEKVYVQGAEGFLACLKSESGEVVWKKNLKDAYKTKSAVWGYASQPLIDGKKLIVIAGGTGSHCVALNKETGEEIWRTGTATEQGYSPPLLIEQASVRQLILCSPDSIYSVDPETGKPFWSQAYQGDNGSIIMTPIRSKNYLFAGGFNNRNILIEMATDKPDAKTLWRDQAKSGLSSVNVQPFLLDGLVYGFDQSGEFRCFELPSGKSLWSTSKPLGDRKLGSGTVFLVRANATDRFWMFAETGDLIIGQLSPKGFVELSRMHVLEPTNSAFGREVVWCAPAYANRKMFVRNDKEIVCVDLAK